MKQWSIYRLILDDGESVYAEMIPGESEKHAAGYANSTGLEILKVTEDKETTIDPGRLAATLASAGYDQKEIDIVYRAIYQAGLDRKRQ